MSTTRSITSLFDYKKILAAVILFVVCILPSISIAEGGALIDVETAGEDVGTTDQEGGVPAGTVSCFDYYTFGSVQADLHTSMTNVVSGTPVTFTGTLVNDNAYPIVDGALYVKVFRSRGDADDGNGPDVVDQFFVKGDIVIPAKGSVPVSFRWNVPSYAQSGEYQLATFFTTSRKFNLLGLSFTDDVVGNTVAFNVTGEGVGTVSFDKSGVTVNNEPYLFAAFPPHVDATSTVTVSAKIRNTTGTSQSATLAWTVYQWDAQLRENVVKEETKQVTVPANASSDVSVTITDTKYPVYYVVGTIRWKDTQSVIGARFVRDGIERTRINFPGVTSFPLKAGQQNDLFSCLHNAGDSTVSGGSLDLTLADRAGNVIHHYRYDGEITSDMMGLVSRFTPEEDYDYFTLSAKLFQGDTFVDEANLVYDCERIDPTLCSPKSARSANNIFTSTQSLAVIGGGIVILILVLWIYRRLMRRPNRNTTPLPPI